MSGAARRKPPDSYDRVAHLYDADMGRNMRFDDVAFYARMAREAGGPALELGCGNGRILLELQAAGIDAYGADASAPMLAALAAKAVARGLPLRAMRMDARALAFGRTFASVLCPYSLITYMSGAGDVAALLGEARRVLRPGGRLVVDAFVPREPADALEASAPGSFRDDYRRPLGDGTLARAKRIERLGAGLNRIERRYEVLDATGNLEARIDTVDEIREFPLEATLEALHDAGYACESVWWDYGDAKPTPDAQFYTAVARAPG